MMAGFGQDRIMSPWRTYIETSHARAWLRARLSFWAYREISPESRCIPTGVPRETAGTTDSLPPPRRFALPSADRMRSRLYFSGHRRRSLGNNLLRPPFLTIDDMPAWLDRVAGVGRNPEAARPVTRCPRTNEN